MTIAISIVAGIIVFLAFCVFYNGYRNLKWFNKLHAIHTKIRDNQALTEKEAAQWQEHHQWYFDALKIVNSQREEPL